MIHPSQQTETEFFRHPLSDLTTFNQNTHLHTAQTSPTKNSHKSIKHPPSQQPESDNKDELLIIKVQPKSANQSTKGQSQQKLDHQTSIQPLNSYQQDSLPKNHYVQSSTPNIIHQKPHKVIYVKKFTQNPRQYLTQKLGENHLARFKISRKSTIWQNNIFTLLQGNSGSSQFVEFKKQFKLFGTKAIIQINSNKSSIQEEEECEKPVNNQIGWIQSNFDGSVFDVYQYGHFGGSDKLVATINYTGTQCMGGARLVKIFINKKQDSNSLPSQKMNLKAEFEANPNTESIELIESLSPQYDQESKTYSICFKTARPSKPSTHNILLLNSQSKASLKFYKVEQKQYLVECLRSVTPLIGLSYSFSSFAFKLATQ